MRSAQDCSLPESLPTTSMADISLDPPKESWNGRLNDLLEEIWKSKTKLCPYDQYGNFCYSLHMLACRNMVDDFLRVDVLDYVKQKDERFSGTVHGVGSTYAGVSVSSNEADLIYMVKIEGILEECEDLPGFARYNLSRDSLEKWKDCATMDGYLMSRKVSTLFYHHIEAALESDLKNKLTREGNIPNVSLTGLGTVATTVTVKYTNATVDIDLVIAIECEGLPPLANASWLQGSSAWPDADLAAKIKDSGVQLVSKVPYPHDEDEESTIWRISFSLAETMLLQELEKNIEAYKLCSKHCLVLMKYYRTCYLVPEEKNTTPVLKSYYLKVLFLWECHKYPEPSFWTYDKFAERFLSMFKHLFDCFNRNCIPDFFMPKLNILPSSPQLRNLKALIDDPTHALEDWRKGIYFRMLFEC